MRRGIGRLRAGGGIAVSPPTTTNMVGFWQKGVGITSAANAVSAWADQSGLGHNLLQATGANQPTLQAGGTILFNGTSHFLGVSYVAALPRTRYIRFKQVTWAANKGIISGNTVNTGLVFQLTTTPNIGSYNGAQGPQSTASSVGSWCSLAVTNTNSANDVLQIDGTTVTGPTASGVAIDGMIVGCNGSGATNPSNIEVACVIDYTAEHDAATRASIIAYLNTQ